MKALSVYLLFIFPKNKSPISNDFNLTEYWGLYVCWFTYLCIKTIILNNMHFRITVVNLQRSNTAIFFLTLGITPECLWVHRILYYVLNVYIVFWTDDNGIWNNYIDSWFVLVTSIARGNIRFKICKYWNFHSQYNDIAVSYFFLNFTISSLILVNKSSQTMAIYKYE